MKTGSNVIQNPSDPDATYNGHKGVGYQVQICETADSKNEVQIVTSILAQTAVKSDAKALDLMLEKLEKKDRFFEEFCDTWWFSMVSRSLRERLESGPKPPEPRFQALKLR